MKDYREKVYFILTAPDYLGVDVYEDITGDNLAHYFSDFATEGEFDTFCALAGDFIDPMDDPVFDIFPSIDMNSAGPDELDLIALGYLDSAASGWALEKLMDLYFAGDLDMDDDFDLTFKVKTKKGNRIVDQINLSDIKAAAGDVEDDYEEDYDFDEELEEDW